MSSFSKQKASAHPLSKRRMVFFFLGYLLFGLLSGSSAYAQGSLILLQKRVVFEGSKNIEILEYGNFGRDTATYVISLIQMRMKENGTFETITEPDSSQLFADNYLRFYPHRMTLSANESQSMKIQLINNQNLQAGEYRSHLYFRAEPNSKEMQKLAGENQEDVQVSVKTEFGIAIPVIIRVGKSTTSVQMTDLVLEKQNNTYLVNLCLRRSGNFSTYGHLTVTYESVKGKKQKWEM